MKTITFDSFVRGMLTVLGIGCALFVINYLSSVLLPFFIAWLLAYMIQPLVAFFQYRLKFRNRILSIVVSLLLIVVVVAAIVMFVVPPMIEQFSKLTAFLVDYAEKGAKNAIIPGTIENSIREWVINQHFERYLKGDVVDTAKQALPQVWNIALGTVSIILSIISSVITLLYMIFLLYDYEHISNGWLNYVPRKHRSFVATLVHDVEVGMNSYFRGQATVAFFVGIVFAVGFSIIDFPVAIGLGILFGILNLVPYLQYLGFVPAIILALLKSAETGQNFWGIMGGVVIVFAVAQIVQDLFLIPRIMGKVMGLKPAMILLSLSIWGSLLGIIGMIIALPATTLIISYYKRYVLKTEEKTIDNE